VAGGEIDDAEAAHADTAPAIDMYAFVVRTTMANLVAHGLDERMLGRLIETHKTGNTAHRKPATKGSSFEFSIGGGVGANYPGV